MPSGTIVCFGVRMIAPTHSLDKFCIRFVGLDESSISSEYSAELNLQLAADSDNSTCPRLPACSTARSMSRASLRFIRMISSSRITRQFCPDSPFCSRFFLKFFQWLKSWLRRHLWGFPFWGRFWVGLYTFSHNIHIVLQLVLNTLPVVFNTVLLHFFEVSKKADSLQFSEKFLCYEVALYIKGGFYT